MFSIIFCFILGIALIIFQIISIIGNGGLNLFSTGVNLFEILYFLGYFIFGLLGLYILIVAIKEYRKLKTGDNKNTTTNETDEKENEDKEWYIKMIFYIFSIVGAFIVLIGIASIIGYLDKKNCIKHKWQVGLILLIIALGVIALANIIQ